MNARLARRACAALVALAFGAGTCWGCRVAPASQLIGVDQQIALASDVSVAKVVRATALEDGRTEYEFEVQKRLAGPDRQGFTIVGAASKVEDPRKDFDEHKDELFWRDGGGRLFAGTDGVIHPTFVVGASYLAFVGQPITKRSFERIGTSGDYASSRDKWLSYVDAALRDAMQRR